MSFVDDVWSSGRAVPSAVRTALTPASWLYSAGALLRAARYDRGGVIASPVPVLSIGNLSVGGTGKTPIAAWAAAELRARGGHPAIVLRGYGDDEPLVHQRLNRDVPVIADADRVRGAALAHRNGADCVVLDDGFQHRRIARVQDWVLVSAEQWRDDLRVLPAGPLREPVSALGRAQLLLVTRKIASAELADDVARRIGRHAPDAKVACCHLAAEALVNALTDERHPLDALGGKRIVAASAIGNPDAFVAQLAALGMDVVPRTFRDHHAFSDADVASLVALARGTAGVVCTLKDAVKLAPRWTAASPRLWYVSQTVVVERGAAELDHALEAVLAARQGVSSPAG